MKNYYNILGIDQTATTQEIKHAHKLLQTQYSAPDAAKNGYAPEHYIELCVAYDTLINKEKRSEYDRILNSALAISRNNAKGSASGPKPSAIPVQKPPASAGATPAHEEDTALPKRRNTPVKYGIYIGSLALLIAVITFIQIRSQQEQVIPTAAEQAKTGDIALQQPVSAMKDKRSPDPGITVRNTSVNQPAINEAVKQTGPGASSAASRGPVPHKDPAVVRTAPKEIKRNAPMAIAAADKTTANTNQDLTATTRPTIGATKTEVLKALGTPNMIVRYDNDNEIWQYTNRNVYFSNDKIVSLNNESTSNKVYE